jgi:hypothetical protein
MIARLCAMSLGLWKNLGLPARRWPQPAKRMLPPSHTGESTEAKAIQCAHGT